MSNNKRVFLPAFSTRAAKGEDWENRRTPPNSPRVEQRSKTFVIPVQESIRDKFNAILKPASLKNMEIKEGQIRELPPGYALLVQLYKDSEFMNDIRWAGDEQIQNYLREQYPDVIQYLRTHKLRISASIVGNLTSNEFLAQQKVCVDSKSVAVASADTHADVRASIDSKATAVAKAETVACVKGNSSRIV